MMEIHKKYHIERCYIFVNSEDEPNTFRSKTYYFLRIEELMTCVNQIIQYSNTPNFAMFASKEKMVDLRAWLLRNGMSDEDIDKHMKSNKHIDNLWPFFFKTREKCKEFWQSEMGVVFEGSRATNIVDGIIYGGKPAVI